MRQTILGLAALTLVAGCATQPTGSGVGFGEYDDYEAGGGRDLDAQSLGDDTLTALGVESGGSSGGTAPGEGGSPVISDEQNFDAVSARESIESDAARLEAAARAYRVAPAEALPQRSGNSGGASLVEYALATSNPVGRRVYDRSNPSQARFTRACARYSSPDAAQEAFLAAGGPERDRRGVDPDGDGFACYWDPTPFRSARGG